jgi:SAM-dependent MidA family methyltransferase
MLPQTPLLIVANEFFDALPVQQWVGDEERRVTHDSSSFQFTVDGPIRETSPARGEVVGQLANHLASHGGAAVIIDYGYSGGEQGDTLQAMRGHRYADTLEAPGEQDLTAHVDFIALAEAARSKGAKASRVASQGTWLETLGIGARAMALAAKNPADTGSISAARRRLCDEDQMGRLFKVMAITGAGWPEVAGLDS